MKTFIVILIVVLAAVGAYWIFADQEAEISPENNTEVIEDDSDAMEDTDNSSADGGDAMEETPSQGSGQQPGDANPPQSEGPKTVTIRFNGTSYSPSSVSISVGDSVTWINDSATPTWPASAQHPTHTVYPITGGCLGSTFDACKGLAQGESFTFQFTEAGTWNFHDHLKATIFGSVEVSE